MATTKRPKKRQATDSTLRNVRAANKRLDALEGRVAVLERRWARHLGKKD